MNSTSVLMMWILHKDLLYFCAEGLFNIDTTDYL